jgi:hypothetical protein
MKRTIILFSMIFLVNFVYSQEDLIDKDDSTQGWKVKGRVGLGFSQVALSNWAAGGENSFSGTAYLRMAAIYKKGKNNWGNFLSTIYGLQKQGSNDIQKNEDNIEIISKYGRQVSNKWYYTVNLNFRTQYSPGYASAEDSIKISDFFAPAYLNLATGLDFKPNDNFSLLLAPVSGKFTFVLDDYLSSIGQYGVDPGQNTRSEFGGTIQMIYSKENIIKNVTLTTNLDLFSNYFENPEKIDVNWQLYIDFKVNDFLALSLNTHLIYDYDVKFPEIQDGQEVLTDKVQFKEAFTFGLAFTFDAK